MILTIPVGVLYIQIGDSTAICMVSSIDFRADGG